MTEEDVDEIILWVLRDRLSWFRRDVLRMARCKGVTEENARASIKRLHRKGALVDSPQGIEIPGITEDESVVFEVIREEGAKRKRGTDLTLSCVTEIVCLKHGMKPQRAREAMCLLAKRGSIDILNGIQIQRR